ncbi:hypothetical protein AVEN_123811-1 [Araneus ventricosus]|uniref:Uncharacterized protein n=1 Tax=Araneus ventricosus TaxID=182803 RepID=A0A4Y2BL17_ARAVE|nr:hypothetical protein AVEN_123811-1 [Araneus ventricosus]
MQLEPCQTKAPIYRVDLQWKKISNLEPLGPEAETLSLGYHDPSNLELIIQKCVSVGAWSSVKGVRYTVTALGTNVLQSLTKCYYLAEIR